MGFSCFLGKLCPQALLLLLKLWRFTLMWKLFSHIFIFHACKQKIHDINEYCIDFSLPKNMFHFSNCLNLAGIFYLITHKYTYFASASTYTDYEIYMYYHNVSQNMRLLRNWCSKFSNKYHGYIHLKRYEYNITKSLARRNYETSCVLSRLVYWNWPL